MAFALVAAFRRRGWRWPLDEGDEIEVWSGDSHCVGRVPVSLLRHLLLHHLQGVVLEDAIRAVVRAREAPPRKPLRGMNGRRLRGYLAMESKEDNGCPPT